MILFFAQLLLQMKLGQHIYSRGQCVGTSNAWAPSTGALHNEVVDVSNITQDSQDPFSDQIGTPASYSQSLDEELASPNNANLEVDAYGYNRRRLNINKKRSKDPTPSSSGKSKNDAKEAGAKMINQLDKLIEVIATRKLVAQKDTIPTPTCTIMECINLLDDMDQLK
ncbi:hypothetical protein MRB53_006001 [Persea americana]|uniref:Uncharacterized protein n=1 Tax=Persea americana TaxID=3435 RepID=A0ACC2MFF6_PERAE|nr:hypothetical protein MRB53_006001 [Persea americana]